MKSDIAQGHRPCMVNLSKYWCKQLGMDMDGALLSGAHHGFFQCVEDTDCAYPVAVVELYGSQSGRVVTVAAECVIFRTEE